MSHRFCKRLIARITFFTMAIVMVAGCAVLPESRTLTLYRLPAADSQPDQKAPVLPVSLLIRAPYANARIDSTYVLVVPPHSSQISAYGGVRWSDTAPALLRDRLARAFRANGGWAAISVDAGLIDAQLELGGDLDAFQVEYAGDRPVVHVRYDAILIDARSNKNIASRTFDVTEAVNGKEVPEVVDAFGVATDRLSEQVIVWVREYAGTR